MNSLPTTQKIGRNDPCTCGSGKKYKACCLRGKEPVSIKITLEESLKNAWKAVSQKDVKATIHWFREALAIQPDHPEALAGLGQALCWQDRRREGLQYLQQAARHLLEEIQATGNIRFIIQLAAQLHFWGDLETSLALAKHAVQTAPTDAGALNNLALYLLRLNRAEEAEPYARMTCMLRPDEPACNNLLAILETRLGRLTEAQQRFEKIIAQNKDASQTARAQQELVMVLDKLGHYEEAFAACLQAKEYHQQLPEFKRFDPNAVFRALARNKAGFDQALLNRWSVAEFADGLPGPVFLLGFLRSGTTLTEQVLAAHPNIFSSDENNLIHGIVQELGRISGCGDDVPAGLRRIDLETARKLRKYYWQRVQEEYGAGGLQKRFVDKVALNSIDIGLISVLFPDAKILFALRDPRDVCLSCFQQVFQPSNVTVNLSSWSGVAEQYAAVMDFWLHLRDRIAPDYLEIRYEDTVSDFETTFRRIFDLLALDWTDEVNVFHEKAINRYIATPSFVDVSQPLYTRSLARWRHYESFFEPILPKLKPYIEAFGYQ